MSPTVDAPDEDLIVTARSDESGYHLQIAAASGDWEWRNLATVLPEGGDGEPWTGYHCVTGDGRYVMAVVAPRGMANHPTLRDRGALLYRVDIADRTVEPVVAGVALKYYNPGCGVDDRVAVISHGGVDQSSTTVRVFEAETGREVAVAEASGQLTSAVPAGRDADSILATRDGGIVHLGPRGERLVDRVDGTAFSLRANGAGGVDFLTAPTDGSDEAEVWRVDGTRGRARRLGVGPLGETQLFAGRNGESLVVNGDLGRGVGLRRGTTTNGRPVHASLDGSVVAVHLPDEEVEADDTDDAEASPGHGAGEPLPLPGGRELQRASDGVALARDEPSADDARQPSAVPPAPAAPSGELGATVWGTPRCAVPRNDLRRQAPQPNAARVDWAIQQATRNNLRGTVLTRPAGFANMGLAAYQPSVDFPRRTLNGSASSVPVPPSVIQAVFAQESNWAQASWRALPGVAANPLIGDYYGAAGTLDVIDYVNADCGYGVAQVTDPMTAESPLYSANGKTKVAVDYAENVAAGVQFLVDKWNQLQSFGIMANNGDPSRLENWYFAIWAYNTGINPTDASGRWGLGWTNNPMNADYPPDRDLFLRATYADAEHPGDWPYQERVMGWMETPQLDYHGDAKYADPNYQAGGTLNLPERTTFCTPSNSCDVNHEAGDLSYCTLGDRHCWWHEPVTWTNCATACATSAFTVSSTAGEPANDNNYPPNCNTLPPAPLDGRPHVIVDDATPSLNVEGCTPSGWSSGGTFTYQHGTTSAGVPLAEIDWHQLGTGFSGHTWFTKNRTADDTAHITTGTWTPPTLSGRYNIKVHVPPSGASTPSARYTVHRGTGSPTNVTIDQHLHENRWVSLGDFDLVAGARVVLTNVTAETVGGTANVAFDTVAFTPVPSSGQVVDVTIDAAAIFDQAQTTTAGSSVINNLTLDNPNLNDAEVEDYLLSRINPILAKPACSGTTRTSNCVPPSTLFTLTAFRNQIATHPPAVWQGFANTDPPSTLSPGYFDDAHRHKLHNSLNVRYRLVGGLVDPASVAIAFKAQSGITHMPDFMLGLINAVHADYQVAPPDLRYEEENLGTYTHASSAVNPITSGGDVPGREYRPAISEPHVAGECVNIHALGGGMIGWKVALNEGGIAGAYNGWVNAVGDQADAGRAPQELYDLLDGIYHHWWSNQYSQTPIPRYEGSLHRMAPPIWIEQDLQVCGSGTVRPHLSPRIATSSYMPDLYLWVNGVPVDDTGGPRLGPARVGDFGRFSNDPITTNENAFGECILDMVTPGEDQMPLARSGNAWGIEPLVDGKDTGDSVRFCERAVADAYPVSEHLGGG